ncbi:MULTISPECIES: DUF6680 family protein [Klebsiella]|uniref:DUF6680 family protein n=1 Tax=Klebsiella TaxID=570 RepID=UPI0029586AAC|nr:MULTISPECIES: DUF6680 family protein [Klebsiella]
MCDLLSAIAKDIGYDFERVQLQTAIYSPIAHGEIENDQLKIRKGLASIITDEGTIKWRLLVFPAERRVKFIDPIRYSQYLISANLTNYQGVDYG